MILSSSSPSSPATSSRHVMARRTPLLLVALVALATSLVACGRNDKDDQDLDGAQGATRLESRARNGNLSRDGLQSTPGDLNRDDKPDQWTLSGAGGKVLRVERDLNFDGVVDLWQYPGPNGGFVEEEMDLDHDNKVDVVVYYREDGSIEHKELAIEFAGIFTVFKYYDIKEELLRVEQDEDADGKIDRWDYYEEKRLARTGWDEDDDGLPDRFDDL